MTFLNFLHVASAIFLIGPLAVSTSLSPRYVRQGRDGVEVLRFLNRTTRVYAIGSLLVFVLGLAVVRPEHGFGEFWVSSSMTLFVVAAALTLVFVERDQRAALTRIEGGDTANTQASRITAISGAAALMWLAITALMIYKPGG